MATEDVRTLARAQRASDSSVMDTPRRRENDGREEEEEEEEDRAGGYDEEEGSDRFTEFKLDSSLSLSSSSSSSAASRESRVPRGS